MPWVYDGNHSVIAFDNRHLGLSIIKGRFNRAEVALSIDDEDLTRSSVTAVIDATSIDTGNERRDDTLRGDIYLDVARFPTIDFRSSAIEQEGSRYVIVGSLTLHGATHEVRLLTTINGELTDQRGITHRGFSAQIAIRRSDYGISTTLVEGVFMAADAIHLSIELETTLRD
ncbi:MAG: polyisoprenoid-binding protein [Chloroflexi bacterium]|nr:polyisoprenoid-binding protein [Chloroflexota bacterium]